MKKIKQVAAFAFAMVTIGAPAAIAFSGVEWLASRPRVIVTIDDDAVVIQNVPAPIESNAAH